MTSFAITIYGHSVADAML